MKREIKYFVGDLEVATQPENGEHYLQRMYLDGKLVFSLSTKATTPEQRTQQKIEEEKAWRNQELTYIDSQSYGESFPYFTQVEDYKQALRDYPMQPDFPYGERPVRPVNENGNPIIT